MISEQINSLAPGKPGCHFETAIFSLILLIGIFTLSKDNALRWLTRDLTDDKSTLVQVKALCRQATSHYLNQCWPRSLLQYGITRPQCVNSMSTSCEIALRWMPQNNIDGTGVSLDCGWDLPMYCLSCKSASIQVMAWCLQAPSHYLSQC